jgi:hypothetical protein
MRRSEGQAVSVQLAALEVTFLYEYLLLLEICKYPIQEQIVSSRTIFSKGRFVYIDSILSILK